MQVRKPTWLSQQFASELAFAWLTLTGGAGVFAIFASVLSATGFPEAVSFLVPLLVTLVCVVTLHLRRLAKQMSRARQVSISQGKLISQAGKSTDLPLENAIAELFVEYYWSSPPERRAFGIILEDVARELDTRDDRLRMKTELEKASQTIQQMLEGLG
jgi:hypothetical protein